MNFISPTIPIPPLSGLRLPQCFLKSPYDFMLPMCTGFYSYTTGGGWSLRLSPLPPLLLGEDIETQEGHLSLSCYLAS